MSKTGIIGFGEVGGILAADLAAQGAGVAAFDIAPAARARAEAAGIARPSPQAAIHDAGTVFVCVTAGSVLEGMRSLAGGLGHRPFVVDVNSVAPETKQAAAAIIEAA